MCEVPRVHGPLITVAPPEDPPALAKHDQLGRILQPARAVGRSCGVEIMQAGEHREVQRATLAEEIAALKARITGLEKSRGASER